VISNPLDPRAAHLLGSDRVRVAIAPLLLLMTGAEPAQPDRIQANSRPVEMSSSGGLSIDMKRQVGFTKGDVVIKRDDVLVCCDEAEAKYAGSKIERITCRGRVVIIRPDGTRATANLAVFEAAADKVTLTGEAHVVKEDSAITGSRIIYDIGRDHLEVDGSRSTVKFKQPGKDEIPSRPCPPPEKK
jgi:lipopolysaccharide transport protein LptA